MTSPKSLVSARQPGVAACVFKTGAAVLPTMRLTQKLVRPFTTQGWLSIRHGFYRLSHPLSWRTILAAMDAPGLAAFMARYGVKGEKTHWPKYVETAEWLRINVRRAQDLRLNDRRRPLRVLDLGSGPGHFLFVCRFLGHSGLGLDTADFEFYNEMFEFLGLDRVVDRIEKFQPLSEELLVRSHGEKFDLITAFAICFNDHRAPGVWRLPEWEFFLRDVRERLLAPGGCIYLDFNPEPDGSFFPPELFAWFQAQGARIDRSKVLLPAI